MKFTKKWDKAYKEKIYVRKKFKIERINLFST